MVTVKLLPVEKRLLFENGNLIPHIPVVLYSGADFHAGKKLQFPTYRDCLKERGTIQMLTVSREVALEVQVSCIAVTNKNFNRSIFFLLFTLLIS
jgi:hypothetical protein